MYTTFFIYLAGVAVGAVFMLIIKDIREYGGTLKVDYTNPEKDVYRIELNNLDMLDKKKRILLKIEHDADLSHK